MSRNTFAPSRANFHVRQAVNPKSLLLFDDPDYAAPTPEDIRGALKALELSGAEAAALLGVDSRTIRKWTGGERAIPFSAWRLLTLSSGKTMVKRLCDVQIPWASLRPEQFQWVHCSICGRSSDSNIASLVINQVEFFLVQCPDCDVVWRNPIPDANFLDDLYADEYYKVDEGLKFQVGIADNTQQHAVDRQNATHKEVARWIEMGIEPQNKAGEPSTLLEIGGGRGYLQRAAEEAGWRTTGLEISSHGLAGSIKNDIRVLPMPLEDLLKILPYERYFDVVAFFDFLEHIPDPGLVLRTVRKMLSDDGWAIVRIPADGDDPQLHLVDHIWHFTERSIYRLFEKEGFHVEKIWPSGTFVEPKSGHKIENLTVFARRAAS
ncbi:MAG: methyltransferase domain-containing protein [Gammaproteobacteria bacterium]